jgi:hypothetical protein
MTHQYGNSGNDVIICRVGNIPSSLAKGVGELKMAAPSEEKLICDKFNLEAVTVNQVKSFKALADGKDVFIGIKTGSGIFAISQSMVLHCISKLIFDTLLWA